MLLYRDIEITPLLFRRCFKIIVIVIARSAISVQENYQNLSCQNTASLNLEYFDSLRPSKRERQRLVFFFSLSFRLLSKNANKNNHVNAISSSITPFEMCCVNKKCESEFLDVFERGKCAANYAFSHSTSIRKKKKNAAVFLSAPS